MSIDDRVCWFARSKTRSLIAPAARCCRGTPRDRDRGAATARGQRVRPAQEPSPPARRRGRCARGSAPAWPAAAVRRPVDRAVGAGWPASAGSGSIAVPAVVPALGPPPARRLGPPRRRPPPAPPHRAGQATLSERRIRARPRPRCRRASRARPAGRPRRRGSVARGAVAAPERGRRLASVPGSPWQPPRVALPRPRAAPGRLATADARAATRSPPRRAPSSAEARARVPVVRRHPRPARGPRGRSPGPPRSGPERGRATRAARRPRVRPRHAGTRSRSLRTGDAADLVTHVLDIEHVGDQIAERDGG